MVKNLERGREEGREGGRGENGGEEKEKEKWITNSSSALATKLVVVVGNVVSLLVEVHSEGMTCPAENMENSKH